MPFVFDRGKFFTFHLIPNASTSLSFKLSCISNKEWWDSSMIISHALFLFMILYPFYTVFILFYFIFNFHGHRRDSKLVPNELRPSKRNLSERTLKAHRYQGKWNQCWRWEAKFRTSCATEKMLYSRWRRQSISWLVLCGNSLISSPLS